MLLCVQSSSQVFTDLDFSISACIGKEVFQVFRQESFWKPDGNIIIEPLEMIKNLSTPYMDELWSLCSKILLAL